VTTGATRTQAQFFVDGNHSRVSAAAIWPRATLAGTYIHDATAGPPGSYAPGRVK
jgi:hypothetical protein